jgi:hypothetical protein
MVVLLGVLFGAAYYGWQTIVDPDGGNTDTASNGPRGTPCKHKVTIKKGARIQTGDVRVNVYNTGTRSGLAGETLDELVQNGFHRGVADNAPGNLSTRNATVLLVHGKAVPQVQLVRKQFIGTVTVHKGPALAPGVDILVGDAFRGVRAAAPKSVRVHKAVTTCAPRRGS